VKYSSILEALGSPNGSYLNTSLGGIMGISEERLAELEQKISSLQKQQSSGTVKVLKSVAIVIPFLIIAFTVISSIQAIIYNTKISDGYFNSYNNIFDLGAIMDMVASIIVALALGLIIWLLADLIDKTNKTK